MIVKITRGGRTAGLMAYLVGPGRSNEHEAAHLVGGSAGVMAWYSTNELSLADGVKVGDYLDKPRLVSGTKITTAVKEYDEHAGQMVGTGERRDAHVWHCSLSLAPDHDPLGDDIWEEIASEFVDEMGFTETSGKSPCRWTAVHHGTSKNGGDHIHIAVNLVREDGTKASVHYDYKRASRIVAELEDKHELHVVEGRRAGRSARPESRAETETASRAGGTETYSARLSRTVRACAAASEDEAEFVRRCRREGLWVKPRFAAESHDVVVGYSVAERPSFGQSATWRAGGYLGRDLTLPRLREGWTDAPAAAANASTEWQAAWRGQPIAAPGREGLEVDPKLWKTYAAEVAELREQLRQIPLDDHSTWARVAHETSGAFAAWSVRLEDTPGPLAEASATLAKSAAQHPRNTRPAPVRELSMRGPAYLLMAVAAGTDSRTGQAIIMRQLLNTLRALHDAQVATGQARTASQLADTVRGKLAQIVHTLPTIEAVESAGSAAATDRRSPVSPVPNEIKPARERAAQQRGANSRDAGFER
jgi:hypothetical protein